MTEESPDWDLVIRTCESLVRVNFPEEYERFSKMNPNEKIDYFNKNRERFIGQKTNRELVDSINKVLHPLLASVMQRRIDFGTIVTECTQQIRQKTIGIVGYHNTMIQVLIPSPSRTPEMKSQLILPSYLSLAEGPFFAEINLLVFLVISGRTHYYQIDKEGKRNARKDIASLSKISEESMRNKLTFLRHEGFSMIADNILDIDLRNAIAHSDYDVSSDGVISYFKVYEKGAKKEPVKATTDELLQKHEQLLAMTVAINDSLVTFFEKWVSDFIGNFPEDVQKQLKRAFNL
jgi:hypothetical protein